MDKFNEFYENLELQCLSLQEVAELSYATGQQSRQAEINQLQSQINEMAEVGLSQESVIKEKDKRIEELEKSEFALAKVKQILNKRIKTRLLESIIVSELIDLLRGEHE